MDQTSGIIMCSIRKINRYFRWKIKNKNMQPPRESPIITHNGHTRHSSATQTSHASTYLMIYWGLSWQLHWYGTKSFKIPYQAYRQVHSSIDAWSFCASPHVRSHRRGPNSYKKYPWRWSHMVHIKGDLGIYIQWSDILRLPSTKQGTKYKKVNSRSSKPIIPIAEEVSETSRTAATQRNWTPI